MTHDDTASDHTDTFDVVIIGGGIVGLTLAARLCHRNALRVAVVDAGQAPVVPDEALTLRTTSLNATALAMLEEAGVMAHLPARFLTDFDRLEVGSRERPSALAFSAADIDRERFGVFVENDRLRAALWQRLTEMPNATLLEGARLERLERDETRARVTLDGGRQLETALVVGADGARSRVRHLAGIESRQRDYAQEAMVINVRLARDAGHTTWQTFTPSGPVALLPLHERQASLIWYDSPEATRRRAGLDDEALHRAVRQTFPTRLGELETIVERGHFPISRLHAGRYSATRLALVGDAAHVIHPLAGQGVNLGMADVRALVEAIEAGESPGASAVLSRYQRQQWPRNAAMLFGVEQLHYLFTLPFAPLRHLAERGLAGADRFSYIKRFLMALATGDSPRPDAPDRDSSDHDPSHR